MNLKTMQQMFHKASEEVPRTLVTEKKIKTQKDSKKLEKKLQTILKIADLKISKNLSLHLNALQ